MSVFGDRLLGVNLVFGCQRVGCEATAVVDLGEVEEGRPLDPMQTATNEEWPEGWGWDATGFDRILHCPQHRAKADSEG